MMLFTVISLLSLASGILAQGRGYTDSCSNCAIGYSNQNRIVAYCSSCNNENGGANTNPPPSILLGDCFANTNGLMNYQRYGAFDESCLLDAQSYSGSAMKASCNNGKGQTFVNGVDLYDYVSNCNGNLCC